ncbi:MAG TPA: acyl-CoA thioester hydrolase/BAAT C-terminal domain-containing protein [Vicinamibacterales bacterium]|nr:acyl-CoA thioester hydrolase/BAAT C-terminal domain-containing protein [Vicinamibacterales bacterium]
MLWLGAADTLRAVHIPDYPMPNHLLVRSVLLVALSLCLAPAQSSNARMTLASDGFVAEWLPSTTSDACPALVLGGAEGGVPRRLAEAAMAQGMAALALAYFNADGLPAELENIPLEYFDKPIARLAAQAPAGCRGVTLLGWSKGAELALLLASRDTRISAVLAISPSHVTWPGILKDWRKVPGASWTIAGQPRPFVPFDSTRGATNLVELYTHSLKQAEAVAAAGIEVEAIRGRVLLLSGSRDDVWPAEAMAAAVCQRMTRNGRGADCEHRNFADLGHLLDERFMPGSANAHPAQTVFAGFLRQIKSSGET